MRSEGLRMRVWVRALAYADVDAGRTGVCVCYLLFTIQLHAVAQQLQKIQTKEGGKRDRARKGAPEREGEKERGKKTKGKKNEGYSLGRARPTLLSLRFAASHPPPPRGARRHHISDPSIP